MGPLDRPLPAAAIELSGRAAGKAPAPYVRVWEQSYGNGLTFSVKGSGVCLVSSLVKLRKQER